MMYMTEFDTIAAICTAPGGAIAIIRISGPDALELLNRVCFRKEKISAQDARKAILTPVLAPDGERCLAIYMPGPASYTGEDVAEIQCHGGDFAPDRILRAVLDAGARPADGGEFTRRAFLHGKLDLTQAEAVADMISAKSHAAGILAERQMSGAIGSKLRNCRKELIHILSEIESRMDFSEEELNWMTIPQLLAVIRPVTETLTKMRNSAAAGALIRDGIRLVIAGAPNAGKSSLLNAMLGYERAIVTDIPGTTRDTVEEHLSIGGIRIRATDTAGLRMTGDAAEQIGVERARKTIASADLIIWLLDLSEKENLAQKIRHFREECPGGIPVIVCWNKSDLPHDTLPEIPDHAPILISAGTGEGLPELAKRIEETVWKGADRHESEAAVSQRHAVLLSEAIPRLKSAAGGIEREEWEIAAAELRRSVEALGRITGETASPDILDEIFSRFCIGK